MIAPGRTGTVSGVQSDPSAPTGVDLARPNAARIYDYLVGGTANWSIDREFARAVIQRIPLARDMALANRLFLNRVVRHLTRLGVRQFLDVGAGVPTAGNTHQIADELVPDARVVYVDNEPIAIAHAEVLLNREGDPGRHVMINADLREPDDLWRQVRNAGILDLDQPIALLLVAVLHFFHAGPAGQDVGAESVARYRELLAPGSYLAISHLTDDGVPDGMVAQLAESKRAYKQSVNNHLITRPRAEIDALFGDFELLEPGTVWTPQWHPEDTGPTAPAINLPTPEHAAVWAGVGQKPTR
jgi:hypothetical protein